MAVVDRAVRPIETPEGLVLPFRRAGVPERFVALVLDLIFMFLLIVILALAEFPLRFLLGGVGFTIIAVAAFIVANFYFVILELRPGGATLGKWVLGLRVISRDGGPLTPQAVLARNLTRNIEVLWPIVLLLEPSSIVGVGPAWGGLIAGLWIFVFSLMPLFNRDRLRVGDLIGGTLVVMAPKARLAPDMADTFEDEREDSARVVFTRDQLSHYGIHELHVLEDVLRRSEGIYSSELVERVASRIKEKIDWFEDFETDDRLFLSEFYRAQRKYLEDRLVMGKRRESKYDQTE